MEPEPQFQPEPTFEPDPQPTMIHESVPAPTPAHDEVISLDAMRTPPPTYAAEDLDVPAFMRKRSDVM